MRAPWRRRARGSTVVELALVVLLLVPVGACLVLLGGVLHRAAGLERAAYAAARYLVSVPRTQMSAEAGYLQASSAALAIANASLVAAGQPALGRTGFTVLCTSSCGGANLPLSITVQLRADVAADSWDALTNTLLNAQDRELRAQVTLRYEN